MKRLFLLFITVLFFTVYSCGPSIEGETKNWDRNIQQLEKMQKDYPAYADMIKAKIEEAENIYDKATGISDEEAKAKKMREANNLLNSGCIGNLKNMSSKIDDVKEKKKELKKILKDKSKSDIKYAELIMDDSKSAIKKAEKVLNKKAENLDANPCLKIESAYKDLEAAYKDIEETISNFKDQDREKEEELNKEELSKDNDKKDEPKTVECPYCGKKNDAGRTECKYCGAPL